MNKIIFIDTETGGVNPEKAALIQLSGIIRIDKKDVEKFNFYIKPFENSEVTEKALEVQGRTLEKLKTDKFIVAGYNVRFDVDILKAFFQRHGNNFLFSYLDSSMLDPLYSIRLLQIAEVLPVLENNKLETWCKHFGIELKAHDSLEDIEATKKLIGKLISLIRK